MNCEAPGWIWGYDVDTHVDSRDRLPWPYELEGASNEPSTVEQQELKRIFEQYAGPEYPGLAYDISSRYMRRMLRCAFEGLNTGWHYGAAERVVKEWRASRA